MTREKEQQIYGLWKKILVNPKRDSFFKDQGKYLMDYEYRVSYKVIKKINLTEMPFEHKAFAFSYLLLIAYLNKNEYRIAYKPNKMEYKIMLGYSGINKKIDYIIKKGGELEKLNLLKNTDIRINRKDVVKKINLNPPETISIYNVRKDFYKTNILVLAEMILTNRDLGVNGFYIYNFILQGHNIAHNDYSHGDKTLHEKMIITNTYIAKGVGASEKTVIKYLDLLVRYEFLTKEQTNIRIRKNDYQPINAYGIVYEKKHISGKEVIENSKYKPKEKTIAEMLAEQREETR